MRTFEAHLVCTASKSSRVLKLLPGACDIHAGSDSSVMVMLMRNRLSQACWLGNALLQVMFAQFSFTYELQSQMSVF